MESAMLRTAAATKPLRASSSQALAGVSLLGPRSAACSVRRWQPSSSMHTTRAALAPLPLPSKYGYVVLTAAAAASLVQWQAFQRASSTVTAWMNHKNMGMLMVSIQRRKSGIKYPKMYEDADPSVFNCYQRAHQNTLENYPSVLGLLLISGLGYPITSSIFGIIWCIGRVVYSLGYYTGDPSKRMRGLFHMFGFLGLLGTSVVLGVRQTALLSPH